MDTRMILTIAILGGTGKEGRGLAYRWAKAGYHVIIGSRDPEKAQKAAGEVNARLGMDTIIGLLNPEAAAACDIAVLTVPYEAHRPTLEGLRQILAGKVLVDVTVALNPGKIPILARPRAGSAALEAQKVLGKKARVVSAFQNISHIHLEADAPIYCDVLVCGGDDDAKAQVIRLVGAAGMNAWDAGPLANSGTVEGLTPILLWINSKHKMKGAGIRIVGD